MNEIIANDFEFKGIKEKAKTIGIVSGTFAPMHAGHLKLVHRSMALNDVTIIIVAGYINDRAEKAEMSLVSRYQRLRDEFSNDKCVYIALLNEKTYKPFADRHGLAEYKKSIHRIISAYVSDSTNAIIYNYVGDASYKPILDEAYPDFTTVLIDRTATDAVPISATQIRNNPQRYWNYIMPSFYGYFRKVVLIAGASSTGKTTLAKNLIKQFGGTWVPEYGRTYTEGWRHTIESSINARDYLGFIDGQLTAIEDALWDRFNHSQLLVLDTDGLITRTYLKLNKECVDDDYRQALIKLTEISIAWTVEHVDIILETPHDTPFVIDGSRDGHLSDLRSAYTDLLNEEIKSFGLTDRLYKLKGETFHIRTNKAAKIVKQLLRKIK